MNRRKGYDSLDDSPQIDGDKGFIGFKSGYKSDILKQGTLHNACNARIETGEIETRNGNDLVYHDETFKDTFAACRYVNPVGDLAESASIALAHATDATIYDPKDEVVEVPYQSGQEVSGEATLLEAFGSLLLTRGSGTKLPCNLPARLGEYPLEYNGQPPSSDGIKVGDYIYVENQFWGITVFDHTYPIEREYVSVPPSKDIDSGLPKLFEVLRVYESGTLMVRNDQELRVSRKGHRIEDSVVIDKATSTIHFHYSDSSAYRKANPVSGLFKMPKASVVIQIYPWAKFADSEDVKAGRADTLGEPVNECRIDLAPIESIEDEFQFSDDWAISGSTLNSNTGHDFKDGDTIKIQGSQDYDGVYPVRRHDFNTIIIDNASIPTQPIERNKSVLAWSESSNLRPADFAVTTANRLAFKGAADLVQFSDVYAPTIINPFFNRVLVNEGTGDSIVAMLPVQDDGLLVFKRNSIYLITATSTLGENLRVIEITRQMGCVSRGSIQQIGSLVYFLSDNGIYVVDSGIRGESNIASPIKALEVLDKPTSESIQDKIEDIDFSKAETFISSYCNNRYYLGLVNKTSPEGKINRVYVYNQLLQSFESIDRIPDDLFPKEFVVIPVSGKNTLHLVTTDSQVISYETALDSIDTYYSVDGTFEEAPVYFSITTRSYNLNTYNLKRWHRVGVTSQSLSNQAALSFGFGTNNPDSASLLFTNTIEDPYRKSNRVIVRKRGQLFYLTITNMLNKTTSLGKLRISEIYVEGSECARSSRDYSTVRTNEAVDLEVLSGVRPERGLFNGLPLVQDASLPEFALMADSIIPSPSYVGDHYVIRSIGGVGTRASVYFHENGILRWFGLNAGNEGNIWEYLNSDFAIPYDDNGERILLTDIWLNEHAEDNKHIVVPIDGVVSVVKDHNRKFEMKDAYLSQWQF